MGVRKTWSITLINSFSAWSKAEPLNPVPHTSSLSYSQDSSTILYQHQGDNRVQTPDFIVLKGLASELYRSTDVIAAVYTRLMVDNRMSRWRRRCLKLGNANGVYFVHKCTPFGVQKSGGLRVPK